MAQLQSSVLRAPAAHGLRNRLRACAFKPAVRCRPTAAVQISSASTDPQPTQTTTTTSSGNSHEWPLWQRVSSAAAVLPLLSAGAAFADETVADAATDAAYAAAYAQDSGATDTVVTLMAGIVFVLLLLVTGGVSSCADVAMEGEKAAAPSDSVHVQLTLWLHVRCSWHSCA